MKSTVTTSVASMILIGNIAVNTNTASAVNTVRGMNMMIVALMTIIMSTEGAATTSISMDTAQVAVTDTNTETRVRAGMTTVIRLTGVASVARRKGTWI